MGRQSSEWREVSICNMSRRDPTGTMRLTCSRVRNLAGRRARFCGWVVVSCAVACCGISIARADELSVPAAASTSAIRADSESNRVVPFQSQRSEFLKIAQGLYDGTNSYLGRGKVIQLQQMLADPDLPPGMRRNLRASLALFFLQDGRVDEAIAEAEALMEEAVSGRAGPPDPNLYRLLGLAYLRQAEVENCVARHHGDCCIFPLRGRGVHGVREPALKARANFEKVLELLPGDLKAIWLLNIVAMTLGDYPEGVAKPFRLPPESFESDFDIGDFPNIAPALGVDTFNLSGGVVVDDFDQDGRLDIVTSTSDPKGPMTFYRNEGDGTFADASDSSRLNDQLGGLNLIGGDYDNDGDTDLFVLRGAWLFDDGRIRNSLLNNNGDGTFSDVTREAGLADPAYPTQAAAWADFDNDGDLDVYVCNESRMPHDPKGDFPSQLFRNNGDGTFSDVAVSAGVTNDRYCKGVAAGDYDNDGDMDLYVSNAGVNRLYRNNGDGTFSDVARQAGVTEPEERSFATWFFDYDNDGWLDLFVAGFQSTIADLAAEALGRPHDGLLPRLYQNRGDGTFRDVTVSMGLNHVYLPMGANFGDLDNDGWLDVYLTTGDPDFQSLMPNVMLRNDGGRRFQDVTQSGGFGHLQKGHGVAFADLDNDGDQDIYHQLGGFFPGDKFRNALFHNPGHNGRFIHISLVGTKSNRDAVGARIQIDVETDAGERELHRAVGVVSSFGGSPRRQEIGLGQAGTIRRLQIDWPASGIRQVFADVPMDGWIRIREEHDEMESVPMSRIPFGITTSQR